jgi:hypothetical protein
MTHGFRLVRFHAWLLCGSLALLATHAEGASVDEATKSQIKTATEYYDRGVKAMDSDKFSDAFAMFQHSYDTVSSPNSHMMIGRALVKLGRLPEAHRELTQTIQQASVTSALQKKYKMTIQAAQKELDEIKDKLAYVTLRQGANVQIQGQSVTPASWQEPQPVMPGTVLVEVRFADGRKFTKRLTLKAGETSDFAVEPPPESPTAHTESAPDSVSQSAPARGSSTSAVSRKSLGYVFGAVGIVGVGAFVGLGLVAASSYGSPKDTCTPQGCPVGALDNEGSKEMLRGIGYAGLGIGVIGLGAGTWLLLSGDPKSPASTSVGMGPSGVQLVQRF